MTAEKWVRGVGVGLLTFLIFSLYLWWPAPIKMETHLAARLWRASDGAEHDFTATFPVWDPRPAHYWGVRGLDPAAEEFCFMTDCVVTKLYDMGYDTDANYTLAQANPLDAPFYQSPSWNTFATVKFGGLEHIEGSESLQ